MKDGISNDVIIRCQKLPFFLFLSLVLGFCSWVQWRRVIMQWVLEVHLVLQRQALWSPESLLGSTATHCCVFRSYGGPQLRHNVRAYTTCSRGFWNSSCTSEFDLENDVHVVCVFMMVLREEMS